MNPVHMKVERESECGLVCSECRSVTSVMYVCRSPGVVDGACRSVTSVMYVCRSPGAVDSA